MNDFLLKPAAVTEPKGKKSQAKGKTPADNDQDVLYRRALSEINLQNYRAALPLFDQFLKKFPRSHLAGNAQYWKGEALYASKDYANAILEFQKVVKNHAKSEKVPGAVLKQGYCFYEMQNYPDSKAFLEKVITNHPTSGEAAQAKERLHKIEQVLAKKPATAPATQAVTK
jgi:tol-pal system protein YbgF